MRQLRKRRDDLPEQKALDENSAELTRVADEYATAKERLRSLESQQRRHEQDLAAVESRRKSEEGRLYSGQIDSEREVEAIRAELGSLRSRKTDLEEAELEVMEQREELDEQLERLQQRHVELDGQVDGLVAARDTAAADIDAELAQRHTEREEIAAELSDDVRAYYEELRSRKQGLAVAELQGRVCAGCRLELTQIEYEEVLDDADRGLARCAQCDRILVPAG
jgi:predicted  nucleic acid-binding Zn-ribbon protein